jgi:hypothetical protein
MPAVPEHDQVDPVLPYGLAFGTISATYGLNAGIIDRAQFSVLVSVVVLTAVVPTAIAQRFFTPRPEPAGAPPATAPEPVGRQLDLEDEPA